MARVPAAREAPAPVARPRQRADPGVGAGAPVIDPGGRDVAQPAAGRAQAVLPLLLVAVAAERRVERTDPLDRRASQREVGAPQELGVAVVRAEVEVGDGQRLTAAGVQVAALEARPDRPAEGLVLGVGLGRLEQGAEPTVPDVDVVVEEAEQVARGGVDGGVARDVDAALFAERDVARAVPLGDGLGRGVAGVVLDDDQLGPVALGLAGGRGQRDGQIIGPAAGGEEDRRGRGHAGSELRLPAVSVDVALLSCRTTLGWRRNDDAFAQLVREAGATCAVIPVTVGRAGALRRHPALTDLVEALAARHSATRLPPARAAVVSTVTASFFVDLPMPYAVRFDAPTVLNRPGWAGAWQRAIEPRALARARLLLPLSVEAAAPLHVEGPAVVPVGVPIARVERAPEADIDVLTYAGNPHKRALDVVCAAWALAGSPGRLVVAGIDPARGREWLARRGVPEPAGLEWAGIVPQSSWHELLGRSRVFVAAPRFEDHGVAPLEALSAGALLVTTPSPGPYPALAMARSLDAELVTADRSAFGPGAGAGRGPGALRRRASRLRGAGRRAARAAPGRGDQEDDRRARPAGARRRDDVVVDLVPDSGDGVDPIPAPGALREGRGVTAVARRHGLDRLGEAVHVAGRHQHAGVVVDDLGNAPYPRRDDRQPAGHRLEQDDGQVLEPARQHEQVRRPHRLRDRGGVAGTQEPHRVAEPEPARLLAQLRQELAVADDVERRRARPAGPARASRSAWHFLAASEATLSSRSGSPAARRRGVAGGWNTAVSTTFGTTR